MRLRIIVVVLLVLTVGAMNVNAENASKESEKRGGMKDDGVDKAKTSDYMASMWSKIVKSGKKKTSSVPTAVAGLRGSAQNEENELTPYWKGMDKGKDVKSMSEIEEQINRKEYSGAIEALKTFGPSYPESPLKPIASLILAYCYSQTGNDSAAKVVFEGFLKDYPGHELAADAREGIDIIKNEGTN